MNQNLFLIEKRKLPVGQWPGNWTDVATGFVGLVNHLSSSVLSGHSSTRHLYKTALQCVAPFHKFEECIFCTWEETVLCLPYAAAIDTAFLLCFHKEEVWCKGSRIFFVFDSLLLLFFTIFFPPLLPETCDSGIALGSCGWQILYSLH